MTTTFSRQILQTIEDFASGLQINQIVQAGNGSVSFLLDRVGLIGFFPAEDGSRTLISLKRTPGHPPQVEDLDSFLRLANREPYLRAPINAGLAMDGGLLLIASLNNDDFDRQTIQSCLDRLIGLHDGTGTN
ncbi:hypothetical protein C8N35_111127 [Breoghania corrubedonensis]|uniref:Tir chaperone family protein CesT n=1 Tax=Breoghania corrubedonensis TaxID=665038 RepID=A0A2T5UYT3_9HYPH|nr:hypothetical protein [Breoghania corrubedonensis]PTW56664.1 hypothetical protein C8N35_111127 [Breoghania corrubedonensis]